MSSRSIGMRLKEERGGGGGGHYIPTRNIMQDLVKNPARFLNVS